MTVEGIQWFPGHMARAKRLITEAVDQADVVIEVIDARCPQASRNPVLDGWVKKKPRLLLLNKADLADPQVTGLWAAALRRGDAEGGGAIETLVVSIKRRAGREEVIAKARSLCAGKKWFGMRSVRGLVVGIPNVGKSSLVNWLAGERKASVADRAGHTRGVTRLKVADGFDLLDTPGVLWPKFEDPRVGKLLAFLGSVKDEILPVAELAAEALGVLNVLYTDRITERWGAEVAAALDPWEALNLLGRRRGFLVKGGGVDLDRAGLTVLKEVREGLLGPITWERPGGEVLWVNEKILDDDQKLD